MSTRLPVNHQRRRLMIGLSAAACLPRVAQASAYPASAVRVVVPFPPGGTVDTLTRLLIPAMAGQLGQQVVVVNQGGGNGTIGAKAVAQAKPDGYTLMLTASNHVINPLILRTVPYDAINDFTAVSYIGYVPQLVIVRSDFPASTFQEFVELARAKPGTYTWATSGIGTAGHLAEELINQRAGLKMTVAAYRGGGPALTDVIGGHVTAMVEPAPSSMPHVQASRLKALAVTSPKRALSLPQTPTVAESGLPDFDLPSWYGLWGPAGVSGEIVRRLSTEVRSALQAPSVKARLDAISFESVGGSAEDLQELMRRDTAKYAAVVKGAGIVMD